MVDLSNVTGFEWDSGNETKNAKHKVTCQQAEEIFSNAPLWITDDVAHSKLEERARAIGMTDDGQVLVVAFTLRAGGTMIRVISARTLQGRRGRSMKASKKPARRAERYCLPLSESETFDFSKARRVALPKLKPPTVSISIRLPRYLIERVKAAANKRDVPYQSLMKMWLYEKAELKAKP